MTRQSTKEIYIPEMVLPRKTDLLLQENKEQSWYLSNGMEDFNILMTKFVYVCKGRYTFLKALYKSSVYRLFSVELHALLPEALFLCEMWGMLTMRVKFLGLPQTYAPEKMKSFCSLFDRVVRYSYFHIVCIQSSSILKLPSLSPTVFI